MHNERTVVTLYALKGSRKTPLREYNHSRSGKTSNACIIIPFGTEYGLGFKFQSPGRRRLELWIDGGMVSDQLILDGDSFLERFVDSDRRFRFVEATNAAVADPTSPSNGVIEIKLWNEVPKIPVWNLPITIKRDPWRDTPPHWPWPQPWQPYWYEHNVTCETYEGAGCDCSGGQHTDCSFATPPISAPSSDASHVLRGMGMGQVGATVEGSASNQIFCSTEWNGDMGEPLIFQFKLEGPAQQVSPQERYCKNCGTKKQIPATPFCSNCGNRL